jgi:hypothetical protein
MSYNYYSLPNIFMVKGRGNIWIEERVQNFGQKNFKEWTSCKRKRNAKY